MQSQNTFQIGQGDGLFDSTTHTQGGLTHLLQHLWDAYCFHLQEEITKCKEAGKPTLDLQAAKTHAPATHFAKWCTKYLEEQRVVESFFVDANLGIRLANNVCVAVCPGVEIRGTMQDSEAVQVTEGKSQPGNNGVIGTDSLRI